MKAKLQFALKVSPLMFCGAYTIRIRFLIATIDLRLIMIVAQQVKYGELLLVNSIDKKKQMSTSKARRRQRPKKFIEKDEENQIGVTDDLNGDYKNKIQEKQEDMFDPHKLKENMFKQSDKSYQNNFIDFGDEQVVEEKKQNIFESQNERQVEKQEQIQKSISQINRKKRGRREKKAIIESDDEKINADEELNENNLNQELTSQLTAQEKQNILSKEQQLKKQQSQSQSDKQQDFSQVSQMIKKRQEQKIVDKYILYHKIIGEAGTNKQERRRAIYTPLEESQNSFVYFRRFQSGFTEYYQAIGQDQRPILFCQNQRGCIGCNYYISLTKQMDKNNPSYLGKLRGNASGSIYQLYDNGLQPSGNIMDRSKFRVSMGYIEYQSNFLGMKGPRKLKAVIPNADSLESFDMFKLLEDQALTMFQPPNVMNLRNKQPRWNERLKSYALNFGGRVKQASIKNFILIDDSYDVKNEDNAANLITFGKIDENTFALEFRHPLSLYQAFGIAMSEFDFKLKCQ